MYLSLEEDKNIWFMSNFVFVFVFVLQKCGFSLEPSQGTSIEATFTPDGKYVLSGNMVKIHFSK